MEWDESDDEKDLTKHRKSRHSLLSQYYGELNVEKTPEQSQQQTPTKTPTKQGNSLSLDSVSFDADAYYNQLLRNKNLVDLMESDNTIMQEIKSLSSDMKTLVYENYNKFISATETIKKVQSFVKKITNKTQNKMKYNVENMETEMERLSSNMEKISSSSEKINQTLSVRRDKIQQLSSIHRLLKKVQYNVKFQHKSISTLKYTIVTIFG